MNGSKVTIADVARESGVSITTVSRVVNGSSPYLSAETRRKVEEAIQKADQGEGVLLLSDMFGGTPCNLCLSFLDAPKVEVVSGINLPMLIKLASLKEAKKLSEIADFIKSYGQKNITRASEVLRASGPAAGGPTASGSTTDRST